jgi:sulfur transfer complex TusBCD TusB component (DsrH family)
MASIPSYLVIHTRDPLAGGADGGIDPLVEALAAGAPTTVVLAQNGVLAARRGSAAAEGVARLASTARVLADEFSLQERGIRTDELAGGVSPATVEEVVDLLMAGGCRAIWR